MGRSILFIFVSMLALMGACSSSSSSAAANPIWCAPPARVSDETGLACTCAKPDATHPANGTACSEASLGVDSVCSLLPDHTGCACSSFSCTRSTATDPIECDYGSALAGTSPSSVVQPSVCVGAHYCMQPTALACLCQMDACAGTDVEVTSCTDAAARAQKGTAFQVYHSNTAVDDCQAALATPGSGSGGSGTNICPGGPGQCRDGDSSTCNCGTSCIQTATCAGCPYECVKGCATDADCAGFYSGDTPPAPLKCLGASSSNPTPHCGL